MPPSTHQDILGFASIRSTNQQCLRYILTLTVDKRSHTRLLRRCGDYSERLPAAIRQERPEVASVWPYPASPYRSDRASFLNEKHRVAARQSVGESGMAFSGIIVKKMVSPRGVGWTVKAAVSASRPPLPAILHISCQLLDCIGIRGLEEYLQIVTSTLIISFSSLKNSFTTVVKFNFECSDPTINSPPPLPCEDHQSRNNVDSYSNNNSKFKTFLVLINFNILSTKMS